MAPARASQRLKIGAALLALAGCRTPPIPPTSHDAGGISFSPPPTKPISPLPQSELPTTDGSIAIGNLQGQIESYEKLYAHGPHGVSLLSGLIGTLSTRGQYLGTLDDYDRAEALAEELVKLAPKSPEAYLYRAGTRSTFHRFADSERDLDEAVKLGAKGLRVVGLRGALFQATGRSGESLVLRHAAVVEKADITTLGLEATVLADLGRTEEAEQRFIEAQHHFRDVAPFPVAWLYFQQGLMWERRGTLSRARELYQAAHERLPLYAPAAAHLAGVLASEGERAQAIALLRPLLDSSTDPEYAGQLSSLLRQEGQATEADALRDRATRRYDALLARHPAAFGDHAARYFLAAGNDPKRALTLAIENARLRDTVDAHQLVLDAALVADTPIGACEAADAATKRCGHEAISDGGVRSSPCGAHLHVLASRAYAACKRPEAAAAELAAAAAQ